jgi:hypothetical protein
MIAPMTATGSAAWATSGSPFTGDHHCWTVHRHERTFVVRVVEPTTYAPSGHGAVFQAVLGELVSPAPTLVDALGAQPISEPNEPFDLATFPEAFVAADDLLSALEALGGALLPGCFHIGLRPTADAGQHLFTKVQILDLVERLATLPHVEKGDLVGFRAWALGRTAKDHCNLGCLFATDVHAKLRICLHPKLVRSKFETHPLNEHHMAEASHLALVTLFPADKTFFSVTLQPLLCSDALNLPTDKKTPPPLEAVNIHAGCFGDTPPDHVDIVTVATCTPQTPLSLETGAEHRAWHEQFLDSFKHAASDGQWARHHHAAFVLSNFLELGRPGGLSGAFLPVATDLHKFPPQVFASAYGRPKPTEKVPNPGGNRWSTPDDGAALETWQGRGFVAGLSPFTHPDAAVRIFGFTIGRLPRDNSRWDVAGGLVGLEVQVGTRKPSGEIAFEREVLRLAS